MTKVMPRCGRRGRAFVLMTTHWQPICCERRRSILWRGSTTKTCPMFPHMSLPAVIRAEGPHICLARPNGPGPVQKNHQGPTARPFVWETSTRWSSLCAFDTVVH